MSNQQPIDETDSHARDIRPVIRIDATEPDVSFDSELTAPADAGLAGAAHDDGPPRDGGARGSGDPGQDPPDALVGLADTSDTLLAEVRELRALEDKKRHTVISSPEFHRLARDVENRALRIWDTAAHERSEGDRIETQPGTTTEDVEEASDDDGRGPTGDGIAGR